jgi:hypothetical protein
MVRIASLSAEIRDLSITNMADVRFLKESEMMNKMRNVIVCEELAVRLSCY